MGMMDHWHPVLYSHELRKEPIAIRLVGEDIVLYRTNQGAAAALREECPHRRMKLSLGAVCGNRLRCRYHGWTYGPDGAGESPGTPKLHATTTSYDVQEKHGVVWLKSRGSAPAFPKLEIDGYLHMGNLRHRVKAPLELVVDNFCEIEHTPTTHAVFGYELDRMHEVTVRHETTDTTVRTINAGPPKRLGPILNWLLGIRPDWVFNDDWTTWFSPVYSCYDHWWSDPATGRESKVRWRLYIFFVPRDETETELFTFSYAKSQWPGPAGGLRLFRWLLRRMLDKEIRLDVDILQGLHSYDTSIDGMKLSRFDRSLGLNRERIQRVYRGQGASAPAACATPGCARAEA